MIRHCRSVALPSWFDGVMARHACRRRQPGVLRADGDGKGLQIRAGRLPSLALGWSVVDLNVPAGQRTSSDISRVRLDLECICEHSWFSKIVHINAVRRLTDTIDASVPEERRVRPNYDKRRHV